MNTKQISLAAFAAVLATVSSAQAGCYTSASSYNTGYGMTPGEENAPINASLRDANGNLTIVNGQFTSSQVSQQSGVQQMSTIGGGMGTLGTVSNSTAGGTSTSTSTASAIGNQLNVVTIGSDNTVVVNSSQTNNGNQTATSGTGH
jgi:holdfast attachment protein HfaA